MPIKPTHPKQTKTHTRHTTRWLPYELRQRFKHANIGWFLHTPFPSSEIYRILPVRKALLEALLAADLLGASLFWFSRYYIMYYILAGGVGGWGCCHRILPVRKALLEALLAADLLVSVVIGPCVYTTCK